MPNDDALTKHLFELLDRKDKHIEMLVAAVLDRAAPRVAAANGLIREPVRPTSSAVEPEQLERDLEELRHTPL